jgi:hypothetical protein
MTDNRKAGIALIAGSLGGILTMAIHPTGGGQLAPKQVAHLAVVSAVAHSIALISVVVLFLGACGLARSMATADRLSFAAIVTFGFACVAIFIAATVSGFIIPDIMKLMARDTSTDPHAWQIVVSGIFQINQAMSRIYSVGASLAIILWSISSLRSSGLSRSVAIFGCLISVLIIAAIGSGHLRLNVHGMAAVWVTQAIWFLLVGSQLCFHPARRASV